MSCPKLDALLYIFNSSFNWLHGFIFFFPLCSLRPGCQALPFSIQWPEIKLQTLTDTPLLPSIILALFHLFLCLGQVRPLLAFISPNSSTIASYLSLFLSPSLPHVTPPLHRPFSSTRGHHSPLSFSLALSTQNAKCLHSNPSSGGDLGFLNWNRRQIKNHWPPPNPDTHPYSLPLPLKLHSNGLNGAFPVRFGADWGRGERSSWQFMTLLKVICKPCASIMKGTT